SAPADIDEAADLLLAFRADDEWAIAVEGRERLGELAVPGETVHLVGRVGSGRFADILHFRKLLLNRLEVREHGPPAAGSFELLERPPRVVTDPGDDLRIGGVERVAAGEHLQRA